MACWPSREPCSSPWLSTLLFKTIGSSVTTLVVYVLFSLPETCKRRRPLDTTGHTGNRSHRLGSIGSDGRDKLSSVYNLCLQSPLPALVTTLTGQSLGLFLSPYNCVVCSERMQPARCRAAIIRQGLLSKHVQKRLHRQAGRART